MADLPPQSPDPQHPLSPRTLMAMVFAGLVLWGLYIAGGLVWYGVNPMGAIVVLACVGLFLGFWALALRTQKRRPRN